MCPVGWDTFWAHVQASGRDLRPTCGQGEGGGVAPAQEADGADQPGAGGGEERGGGEGGQGRQGQGDQELCRAHDSQVGLPAQVQAVGSDGTKEQPLSRNRTNRAVVGPSGVPTIISLQRSTDSKERGPFTISRSC